MLQPLRIGDPLRIGKYALVGRLGKGGMGRVYLGRSPAGRLVAVKLIHRDLAVDPAFRARFAREVEAARKVCGMFTAPVVDADPDDLRPWLVTAYVPGLSLREASAQGPLPVPTVLALAAGLAEGLGAIHAAGLVHRDLQPSNVLLAEDGPRIIDFGISRAADVSAITQGGVVLGAPGFMSPEQAEGKEVGPASDVFSLGGVLVYAATGIGPFGQGPGTALMYRVVHSSPCTDGVPAEIRPLAERCLAKDPADRPTPEQVLAELGGPHLVAGWLPESVSRMIRQHAQPAPGGKGVSEPPGAYPASADGAAAQGLVEAEGPALAGAEPVRADASQQSSPGRASVPGRQSRLPAEHDRPPKHGRRWRLAWAGLAGAVLLPAAAGALVLHAPDKTHAGAAQSPAPPRASQAPSAHPTAAHPPAASPSSHPATSPPARTAAPISSSPPIAETPREVVKAYLAAINSRDWRKVWRLGGENLGQSYPAMIRSLRSTTREVATSITANNERVLVHVLSYKTAGGIRKLRQQYTVLNGVITARRQTLMAAIYPPPAATATTGCDPMRYGPAGTAGPLFCANGHPNPPVLGYYKKMKLLMLTLKPNATLSQVLNAACSDLAHSNYSIEAAAYHLAANVNHWDFGVDVIPEMLLRPCGP